MPPETRAAASPVLDAAGLRKSFTVGGATVEALRGVSFQAAPGEFVAIQGPSGSGKSTLLSLLAGLDRPTAGEVRLAGERIDDAPESLVARVRREKVGFIFQSFHLVPSLTVRENVVLPEAFRTGRMASPRADALLDAVGLGPRAGHFPAQLSGGERQRAAVARALVNDPLLVFADEPTGNLDSVNGARVMELLLAHTRDAGRALVLVTHDDALAKRADRVVRLKDGAVAA